MFTLADSSFLQINKTSPRSTFSYPLKAGVQKSTKISWKSDSYNEAKERRQRNSAAFFCRVSNFWGVGSKNLTSTSMRSKKCIL